MNYLKFVLLLIFGFVCEGGVTDIRSTPDEEATVEAVTEDTWMPSNIFDVKPEPKLMVKEKVKEARNDLPTLDETWDEDSSPLLKAIRDFLFAASDDVLEETEEHNNDPTEEIVKILEKSLTEVTTMLLNPSDVEESTVISEEPLTDQISITKIENGASDTLFDRIGVNLMNLVTTDKLQSLSITNTTTACSSCYDSLQTCVQQCFTDHNCHDVQRQARICSPPASRMCNIFTQWSPVDECQVHKDCKSPLLCCSDGCTNKCSTGVWRD